MSDNRLDKTDCSFCNGNDIKIYPCANGDLGVRAVLSLDSIILFTDKNIAAGYFPVTFCPGCGEPLDNNTSQELRKGYVKMIEKCDVCDKESKDIKVGASRCGSVSWGYCPECRKTKAEPYEAMVAYYALAGYGSYSDFKGIYKEIVDDTLKVVGKTTAEFNKDLELVDQE